MIESNSSEAFRNYKKKEDLIDQTKECILYVYNDTYMWNICIRTKKEKFVRDNTGKCDYFFARVFGSSYPI